MANLLNPKATLFQHLTYENYYLKSQNEHLYQLVNTLQSNVSGLNRFVMTHYDLSFNVAEGIKIMTFDCSGNILCCIHSDASGIFSVCDDMSNNNYLPCVINPNKTIKPVSKTHISDASRCFPYDDYYPYYYPYYGYGYGYYGYPYSSLDYGYYRDFDAEAKDSSPKPHSLPPHPFPNHPPAASNRKHPFPIKNKPAKYSSLGTHIHIHPPL
jgi:hypothetical protein